MDPEVAFVLGGGGRLGAVEVGMLRALVEAGVHADLVLGTSIGAVNGAAWAADPTPEGVDRLEEVWNGVHEAGVFAGNLVSRVRHLARTRTSLHSPDALEALLTDSLPGSFEDLAVPFRCVAACIETAHGTWFDHGPLVRAVMASSAVPGLLPAVEVDGLHYIDGGVIDSIPVGTAVAAGAKTIYVLQVGRVEQPLEVPRWPHEVAMVAFEIARRHSFAATLAALPEEVEVHVLPTGGQGPRPTEWRQFRYGDFGGTADAIDRAYEACAEYLAAPNRQLPPSVAGDQGTQP
ncbi:MAG: patatin-like phospholipase family protein [Microthrixaceae bacterium]